MSVSMTTMCSQELDGNENGAVTETGKRSDALNENGVSHGDAACDTAMMESDAADEEAKDISEYEFRRMMKIQDNMRILRSLGLLEKLIPAPPSTPTQPKGNKKLKATSRVGHVSADQAARAQSGRKHRKPVRFIPGTPRRYFAVGTRVLALRAEIERPAPVLADNESHVTSQTQFLDDAQLRCWKITGSMHIGKLIGKRYADICTLCGSSRPAFLHASCSVNCVLHCCACKTSVPFVHPFLVHGDQTVSIVTLPLLLTSSCF